MFSEHATRALMDLVSTPHEPGIAHCSDCQCRPLVDATQVEA